MSLDGSFSASAALGRLLVRCPALRSDPRLVALSLSAAAASSHDDVAAALAEPFLHPRYTVPVVGCFRPLAGRVVARAVALLRAAAPSLRSESGVEEEVGDGDARVAEFYLSRGRGLRLHELASLALCRALDLAPFLLRFVLSYFEFSPAPFERLRSKGLPSPMLTKELHLLLDATRVSYRLLGMDSKVFMEEWDWSCFMDLVYSTSYLNLVDDMLHDVGLDLRWCAIQILSVVMKASDRATESFGLGADEAFACLLRWEKFCMDTSLEKASCYLQTEDNSRTCVDGPTCSPNAGSLENGCLTDALSTEHEIAAGRKHDNADISCPFILTITMRKSFEMASMAVSQKWPLLLYGPVGAGKTALIKKLARIGGSRALFIHMDEQMDSRTLIGSYICSEKPGEFKWVPGSLTQAIVKGFWIVFEDIDKAPSDVQSILLPLLESSSSFPTGHGEVVEVAESFRLLATITTSKHDISNALEGRLTFNALWRKVMVGEPNQKDMLDIINGCYPSLKSISSKLLDTFEKVNCMVSYRSGGINIAGTLSDGILHRFSVRDLLKWCKRIVAVDLNFVGLGFASSDCSFIYHEAVDIFSASLSSPEERLLIAREIARIFGVPPQAESQPVDKPIIQARHMDLQVGRVTLECTDKPMLKQKAPFADIRHALQVLERVACSIKFNEPVLLVGETGTGKTTLVQNLATWLKQPLTVMNLSQQSDVSDLLGGFKPVDARSICFPLYQEFKGLFHRNFSGKENEAILRHCDVCVMEKKWKKLLHALAKCVEKVQKIIEGCVENAQKLIEGGSKTSSGSKRKRPLSPEVLSDWESFSSRVKFAYNQIKDTTGLSFRFVEGAFITALRNGHWILLDEVNLAPPETLQRISAVLDGERGTLCLAERGDVDYVERHPSFRMFACMNPATDAGKRELPYSFRSRFTEYFVDDLLDDDDLRLFVSKYLGDIYSAHVVVDKIVHFYKAAKRESEEKLQDGANQKPQFSLRSLARALSYTKTAEKKFGFKKALYDGFCMFFLTMLDAPSAKIMKNMILSYLLDGEMPPSIDFLDYFIKKPTQHNASELDELLCSYVLTRSVTEHMVNLARAVYVKRYPVLLQGPTSSGKTSLVRYLAAKTGHEFVRINNHEHTDLQEYFGTYVTDCYGKLQFQEGVLVKAVREGHWIVLDELNLAPSDVLEALNRLLDDNRELFVPELQETIHAHPDFMLFATQNPPVLYGGRKMLSRAFRNRFLEVHVDEIPEDELVTILVQRCTIACSYAKKMVDVMKDLQLRRQSSRVFAGKHGFITPRDLFRWADRYRIFEGKSYDDLAKDGYLLLAERLRDDNEKNVVKETLEQRLRVKLDITNLYKPDGSYGDNLPLSVRDLRVRESFGNITWTKSMWRLYFLVERCYKSREPVLLVGETGGGKTTVCQVLSAVLGVKLHILNCHQYTETSDFIGGFFPIRDRSRLTMEFKHIIAKIRQLKIFTHFAGDAQLSSDLSEADSIIHKLNEIADTYKKDKVLFPELPHQDLDAIEQIKLDLMQLHQRWQAIFLWQDGPLVQAMKNGDLFLIDEISLADDSVLERLNSVLEPERKLSLAEKGGSVLEKITAHPNFLVLATMNPSGDYGKKELSPALRNRFTELWVPAVTDIDELRSIAAERFTKAGLSCFADCVVNFWKWFNQLQTGRLLTIRDLLSWVSFINVTEGDLGPQCALIHGLFLVVLDGLTLGTNISKNEANKLRETCLSFVLEELQKAEGRPLDMHLSKLENYGWGLSKPDHEMVLSKPNHDHPDDHFGIKPFHIATGRFACKQEGFQFLAPTTSRNVLRVLRGMQLPKPVLLEGSPGVGKTSLVVALAGFSGHNVVRINLSEQTDMMDLLGSDLPAQGESSMEFSWSDGILLQALKNGSWVLLDELNLAPQSVLEGLNAILDHRAEVFIPELGQTFKCPPSFRVFACQNPSSQGGGRKGLPKSFLNRFTKVYVDELSADDYLFICQSRYPSIPIEVLSKLICFNNRLHMDTMIYRKYGLEGSPWEFNLRDVIRSCEMIEGSQDTAKVDSFLNTVYVQRMRTAADRKEVLRLFEEVFQKKPTLNQSKMLYISPHCLTVGSASIQRSHFQSSKVWNYHLNILPGTLHSLEAAMHCVQQGWLCILVGEHSSGKTSLIRLLAQLSGNTLNELNLSSATDVSELLGCFEQYNFFRHYKAVVSQVERYVDEYFGLSLDLNWQSLIIERKALFAKWFEFVVGKKCSSVPTSAFMLMSRDKSLPSLSILADIVEQMKCDLEMFDLPISSSKDDLSKTLKSICKLCQNKAIHQPVKFEWVAGDLIRAIERGEWVVLDNANFCNPTVLDRINSLVEQERSIVVNECGLVDGNPVVLNAHPQFRMFLTLNAKYGEVSRAMRNRGVEIFLMGQSSTFEGCNEGYEDSAIPRKNVDLSERKDVIRFLISCGIPRKELVWSMSEAHMYARSAGLRLGINITLLEVARWVQLFQQLLMKGNQFIWSLHLSWEHTYLPSLGETNGLGTVKEGKLRFLTKFDCCKPDLLSGLSLTLPGGWPMEQKLRDFVWYSKEACVRRNCMYLQSLGAQSASYEVSYTKGGISLGGSVGDINPSIIPSTTLVQFLFPNRPTDHSIQTCLSGAFNSVLANQVLFIAANWVMEQATENDIELYVMWFKWYNCQLQPYCQFFGKFGTILEQERGHPIWSSILECYREIIAHQKIDIGVHPVPLLSLKLLSMAGSSSTLKVCRRQLCNALRSLSLLRLTLQQWDMEMTSPDHDMLEDTFLPALKSLRCLEGEVLKVIVHSRKVLQIYSSLLDYHILIWKMIISSQYESLPVAWNLLGKEIMKLQHKFPVEVGVFLMESLNLNNLQDFTLQNQKPTLWVYGGHPLVPPSGTLFYKTQQMLGFLAAVWPWGHLLKQNLDDEHLIKDAMLSTNRELRHLAMEGVCMSSLVATKTEEDDSTIVPKLDEFHQRLHRKVESERRNLELLFKTSTVGAKPCCSVSPDILCRRDGFNSWLAGLPLLNLKSFNLDTVLLQRLARSTWVDSSEAYQIITECQFLLEYAIDYSLKLSSRSPLEFTQHQIIWWIQHAWASVDAVHLKIASSLLEMWYNYHSSLWSYCSGTLKGLFSISHDEPCHLAHLTKMDAIDTIIQETLYATDYQKNCLKLRVASRNMWEGVILPGNLVDSLRASADSLFKQIIFVHKKHFNPDTCSKLESVLFQLSGHSLEKEDLNTVCSLISSSNHGLLASLSVSDKLIGSLLEELYSPHTHDSLYHLGSAWLHIGELRFHLLLSSYSPDPALKCAVVHSHILEKISLLELEEKVCHECEELAGCGSAAEDHNQRSLVLQEMKTKEKHMRAKVVFRPQPSKHKNLVAACSEFGERLSDCKDLLATLSCEGIGPLGVDRACSWQITSTNFIKRLTEEYGEYADLIQPVQVAVYEMKLGLSIALSGALEREYLKKVKEGSIQKVLDAIFIFMQFVTGSIAGIRPASLPYITKSTAIDQLETQNIEDDDMYILKNLAAVSKSSLDKVADNTIYHSQLLVAIHHVSLVRTAYLICCTLLMDRASFLSLRKNFDYFTSLWVDMKSHSKVKENDDSLYYKFRPRIIDLQDIFEGDVPSLSEMESESDVICDDEENLEHKFLETVKKDVKEDDSIDDAWNLIPESVLKCVVTTHNQLFGSPDLVEKPGTCQISDKQKFQSFLESYALGTSILKDVPALTSSRLDEKLMPEHLLRICLEYERTSGLARNSNTYNIYRDANPSVLFKMVEPLTVLQEKVRSFLEEWPEHPGLLKIFDITVSLLAIPLTAPLTQALLGLQLLVEKAQTLQENDSKFSLRDYLPPIFMLVSAWQRLELDCWPILLDEVQQKYEINAGKLWFPLRAFLTRFYSVDSKKEDLTTIKSVEEFVQTSSVGEFKRRLHLLLAFRGELSVGITVGSYSRTCISKIENVLYNAFGYYIQFMPSVVEQIETSRGCIEKELKDQLKLYRWEQDPQSTAAIKNFRKTRHKIFKLLKKFNDVLQQPVIIVLNQEVIGRNVPPWLDPKISDPVNTDVTRFPVDIVNLRNSERFVWFGEWANEASLALKSICNTSAVTADFLNIKDTVVHFMNYKGTESDFKEGWKSFWISLERICSAADVAHVLKQGKKNQKKTALSNLLKTLEGCGLSKHKLIGQEQGDELDAQNQSLLQQSYNVEHLLQQVSSEKSAPDVSIFPPSLNEHANNKSTNEWKHVNQQYFKCVAMMQQLRQISLKFNKDLGLQEVNRAMSFMSHLMTILSEQRSVAYRLFEQLNHFRHECFLLGSEGKSLSLASRQSGLLKYMWSQKWFFDNILAMARDTNLLLRSVKDCHLASCDEVQVEVAAISTVIDKFIPRFLESKNLLDKYFLGSSNVLVGAYKHVPLATKEMEQLVDANYHLIDTFREDVQCSGLQEVSMRSVKQVLLGRFEELLNKGKMSMEEFSVEVEEDKCRLISTLELESSCQQSFMESIGLAISVVQSLTNACISNNDAKTSSEGNITLWKDALQSYIVNLQLDSLCVSIGKTVILVRKLVDYKPEICSRIEVLTRHLHVLLVVIMSFGEGILSEFIDAHKTIAEMTSALGDLFIYLFTEGFGSVEETKEDASDGAQDATGTGMGEGKGVEDVSDMIDDESQLLGTNEKDHKSDQVPNGNERGIEMQDDFDAPALSVSEDSEAESSGDEDQDMNLESQMGATGDTNEVVGEKAWDKDEEDNPPTSAEKYESGSSVKETDQSDREFRAKDESALRDEEAEEMHNEEPTEDTNSEKEPNSCEDIDENTENIMNKADAYEDRTGAELPDPEKDLEDLSMDETEDHEMTDAFDQENIGSDKEDPAESSNPSDHMEEENLTPLDENNDVDEEGEREDENMEPNKEKLESGNVESLMHPSQGTPNDHAQIDNMEAEANWANSSDLNSAIAPSVNLSSNEVPSLEISMPNSGDGSRLSSNFKPELQTDDPLLRMKQTNPFRSIGDAMEDWKERARVSADTQDRQPESEHDIDDENAAEYRYVPEGEQSTSQALGAATSDQIKDDLKGKQSSLQDDSRVCKMEQADEQTPGDDNSEVPQLQALQSLIHKAESGNEFQGREMETDASAAELLQDETDNRPGDLVSFKHPFADEKMVPLDAITDDRELSSLMDLDITDDEMKRAIVEWKTHELSTTRLSQELAEQLRLVMEPTLASKLQGDYRTGKRINMKKVIPYIASHFRRDKIWLRRTKPNKRNYQVVIAVDDSRSMSEGQCGKVAVESLVTVCRAMSQLEVGQFAVASFGGKGNVKLLHDFDQSFTSEAGVKMISSLSFKQDNTIADEPVVDLLRNVNNMLDNCVARSRMPSGQNPLQQLILIIGDGKFHEKENLRRCVRDVLNRKRMIAFILLDSQKESIMDLMEASFGEKLSFQKYLNSFPFPFYVVLKNIEALPRTLADLLRQWFELMQSTNE